MAISMCYLSATKSTFAQEDKVKDKICEGILGTSILAGGTTGFLLGSAATLVIAPIGVPVVILNPKSSWNEKAGMIGAIAGLPILGIPFGYYWGARLGLRLCLLVYGEQQDLQDTIEKIKKAQSLEDLKIIEGLRLVGKET